MMTLSLDKGLAAHGLPTEAGAADIDSQARKFDALCGPVTVTRVKPVGFCDCGSPWCDDSTHRA